jgi:translation initiation factor IF-2
MSDAKPDKPNKILDNEKGKVTLSLKGVEAKSLNKPASSPSGPVVELRQKRRNNSHFSNNNNKKNNNGRSGLVLNSNFNSVTLSKAEQDARNKALDIAKKFKEKEEKEKAEQAENAQLHSEIHAQNAPDADNASTEIILAETKIQEKKNAGPRVLGQVDLNRFAPSKKKTARLEGLDDNRSHAKRDGHKSSGSYVKRTPNSNNSNNTNTNTNSNNSNNSNRERSTYVSRNTESSNNASSSMARNASDNSHANKKNVNTPRLDFSNQKANFSPEVIISAKPAVRKVLPKSKPKGNFDENEANAPKKSLTLNKDRTRKVTIVNAVDENYEGPVKSMAAHRRRLNKRNKALSITESTKVYREVTIPDTITVQELASRMSERSADVVKELMKLGIISTLNKVLDAETAEIIVESMGHTFIRISEAAVENILIDYQDAENTLISRAPVVTIMGHVDHGKTSLLDALRKTDVVSGEAGGITQHIGAYKVRLSDGRGVTFIDTPGHAAFSEMRSRGAKVTDIVILVVAADDGVKPQTVEAIKHAKMANVPIIVAINKIDKHGADASRVRNELLQHEIVVESLGGDVLDVEISAKEKIGLDKLIDTLLLQAEIMDLKANPNRYAQGIVVEAELNKGRGPVATVLIQHGTLRVGDILVAGAAWGRVRALQNDLGQKIEEAKPSEPVEVLGLGAVPLAGDACYVMENDAKARELAEYRDVKLKEKTNLATVKTLDSLMMQIKDSHKKSLPVVIKGDVQGSVEAISVALGKLGNEEVHAQVVHSGVGGITESDINLAEAANGIVFGFNVRANKQARDLAENRKIEIRYYSIIYDLINDVKDALSGMLKPELREKFLGNAEILQVFDITKTGKVAGCRIREGIAKRSAKVRLIRNDVVIHEGVLSTLKRFKDEVKEVQHGYECGMAFENYNDIRENDIIEIFEVQEIARQLA